MQTLFRRMSEDITGFWVADQTSKTEQKSYPDYPINPLGPTRLVSKDTILALMKNKTERE